MPKYEITGETRFKCLGCEAYIEEPEDDPIYECPGCGDRFRRSDTDNGDHRSPCCSKFSSKVADQSCPECSEGEEGFEEVIVVPCPKCDEPFEVGEIGRLVVEGAE